MGPDKRGGLNGSAQHLLKVLLQESRRLISFAVELAGIIGMWEFDPVRPQKPHSDKRTYQDLGAKLLE
jgi:hypothetical protein